MNQVIQDRQATETRWTEVQRQGFRWQLDLERSLDREINDNGCIESRTTDIVRQWVKPGTRILDVGANLGYFTILFAELVGPAGHVWAFEPTRKYGDRIRWHLDANGLGQRATLLNFGLSDAEQERTIDIVDSSASMHLPADSKTRGQETIRLQTLDHVAEEMALPAVEFVKIDIDGHEPYFLKGAEKYLRKHRPAMLMEFAWPHLLAAGTDIWALKAQVEALGYALYSELTLRPIGSDAEFAAEADNREYSSANFWAFPAGRRPEYLPTLAARRVRETIGELRQSLGRAPEVWLFGAGKHTEKAMAGSGDWKGLGRVTGIVDDDPRFAQGASHLGLPVFSRRVAEEKLAAGVKVDAVILSTDTHQKRLAELTEGIGRRGVKIVGLYSS